MFERYTDRARKVMNLVNQEAQRLNHEYFDTEHILLGLVMEGSGVGATVLTNFDVDFRKVRWEVEKMVGCGPDMVIAGRLPQSPRAKMVTEYAIEEAQELNHYVGTEHLLLGLLREQDGVAAQVLLNLNLGLDEVRDEVLNLLGSNTENTREILSDPNLGFASVQRRRRRRISPNQVQWEYRIRQEYFHKNEMAEQWLNRLGRDGWEVIHFDLHEPGRRKLFSCRVLLKRPVEQG